MTTWPAALVLAAVLAGCALPGKPGPVGARDQCAIDAFGVRCDVVPPAPGAVIVSHE